MPAYSNSEESKWMTAGIFSTRWCRGGGGGGVGEATQSLNSLRHQLFGNTKEHTKYETYHQLEHIQRVRLQCESLVLVIWPYTKTDNGVPSV